MTSNRICASIPVSQSKFLADYYNETKKGTSKAIQEAIFLLQEKYLEKCYKMANKEIQDDFEITTSDGINNESW